MPRTVRIRDTLSGEVRELEPRDDARVGIYACGPTVYGPVHVGNARPYLAVVIAAIGDANHFKLRAVMCFQ